MHILKDERKLQLCILIKYMKAVILAGGLGTRLSEETHLKPKPMVEIGGKPINNEQLCASNETKLLGTVWNKTTDTISLRINVKKTDKVTKRIALSQCASVYDIFGIAAPVTLITKILIQRNKNMLRDMGKRH